MKKLFLSIIIFSILLLSGCSKVQLDADGCFSDVDSALKYAAKKDCNVLLFVTMEDDDNDSTELLNKVIRDGNFKTEIASDFAVTRLDFSQKSYAATVVPEGSDEKTEKAANAIADQIQKNTRFASLLNVSQTPSIYILSKESYVLASFFYEAEDKNLSDFNELLQKENQKANQLKEIIKNTKKGSQLERVSAIDALYEATENDYRVFLADLLNSVKSLDKKNESGLLGKYIYAAADANAIKAMNQGKIEEAVKFYIEAAENEFLEPNLKQQAYYVAAYICSITGAGSSFSDSSVIIGYLQKSIDADPESKEVPSIKKVLDVVSSIKSAESELNKVE